MGRFFLGFAIGVALGAAAVIFSARTDDTGERLGLAARSDGLRHLLDGALSAGRAAAGAKEQELRAEYRSRLARRGDRAGIRSATGFTA